MLEKFKESKKVISQFLEGYFKEKRNSVSLIEPWGEDSLERLEEYMSRGKMIRGGLVLLGNRLFGGENSAEALKIAAAMEFFQAALLIHDDIMDEDDMRRGKESIHTQYQAFGNKKHVNNPFHFGESMGICVGDIAIFCAYDILSALDLEPEISKTLFQKVSTELTMVGLGQMQDLFFGEYHTGIKKEDIMNLYQCKTARYTFSLPLMLGAVTVLKDWDHQNIEILNQIGLHLGLVFQIKDDEIGMFGDGVDTGKPVGSDLTEGKMTLFIWELLENSSFDDAEIIRSLFYQTGIREQDIETIRSIADNNGTMKTMNDLIENEIGETRKKISEITGADSEALNVLNQLLDYSISRKK